MYGSRAINLARLIAVARRLWCFWQVPEYSRAMILRRSVRNRDRAAGSL